MERASWRQAILVLMGAIVILAGCGGDESSPTDPLQASLWIDDGPDKPATSIRVMLPVAMWISMTVRDPEGGIVRILREGVLEPGVHIFVWNGRDDEDGPVASGPYWAVLASDDGIEARAMMLVK